MQTVFQYVSQWGVEEWTLVVTSLGLLVGIGNSISRALDRRERCRVDLLESNREIIATIYNLGNAPIFIKSAELRQPELDQPIPISFGIKPYGKRVVNGIETATGFHAIGNWSLDPKRSVEGKVAFHTIQSTWSIGFTQVSGLVCRVVLESGEVFESRPFDVKQTKQTQ